MIFFYQETCQSTKKIKKMKKNIGKTDAVIRLTGMIIIGIVVSTFSLYSPWSFVLSGFALVLLFTAAFETCPIYSLFGISTRKKEINPKNSQ